MALPRELWRWEIDLPRVADVAHARSAAARADAAGSGRRSRPSANGCYADGWPALVSSSAARPEGRVLCVFRAAREILGAKPLPPPERVSDPPVVPTGLRT